MRRLFRQLGWFWQRSQKEAELQEELQFHLDIEAEEREATGVSPNQAQTEARREFGNVLFFKEETRAAWGLLFVERLVQDIRYAFRTMRSNWQFTAIAILSMALGIGANTALFSIVNTALVEELALPSPAELVTFRSVGPNDMRATGRSYGITPTDPSGGPAGSEFPFSIFEQFRSENATLSGLVAFAPASSLNVVAAGRAEITRGQYVSGNYYSVLGIPAFRGRVINPEDDTVSAEPVIVLSYEYWERRFLADPTIIGQSIVVNGLSFTVVGVTPYGLKDPAGMGRSAPPVSIPLAVEVQLPKTNQTLMDQPAAWWLLIMGRLREGETVERVQAHLDPIFQRTIRDDWQNYRTIAGESPRLTLTNEPQMPSLRVVYGEHGVYGVPEQILLVMGVLGVIFTLVLIVVCVNLASLLLSRSLARQREMSVRIAIGAGRGRLVCQLLTENLVLAAIGGAVGVLAAYWCLSLLPTLLPSLPGIFAADQWDFTHMDGVVFAFAATLTLLTVLLFGLVPALRTSRISTSAIDEQRAQTRSKLGRGLLVAQVALSLILLVSGGLFVRSLANLKSVPVGFNPDNVLLFRTDPQLAGYDADQTTELYQRILDRLRGIPGIHSASLSGFAPLSGQQRTAPLFLPGGNTAGVRAATLNVHPDFFETLEIPLLQGRGLNIADGPDRPLVAVVNETFVRTFLADTNAVGSRFGFSPEQAEQVEIVGVVADAKFSSLRDPAPAAFYTPHTQRSGGSSARTFQVRTTVDPEEVVAVTSNAVRQVDPNLPLFGMSTYERSMDATLIHERIFASAASFFGLLALALSVAGLFGSMSYSVARRTKEIGIRMALGAEGSAVLRRILRESLVLVASGILLGLIAIAAMTPLIGSLLFGLPPHDPTTIGSVVLLVLASTAVAGFMPARRASRVDPLVALRYE